MPLELSKEQRERMEQLSISEDEVSDCIEEKLDEGWDRDRAVAACLDMAEEGSTEPEKNVDTMNVEEKEERINELNENQSELKTASFQITGKDVEVVEKDSQDSNGEIVVNVPIQALSEDRDGDFINEKGQEAIIRQLKSETVPLMLNHGIGSNPAMYDARDIVGQFIDGDNRNGTTIGTARMRKSKDGEELHKDAKEIVDLLEQDMPIGFSVGFIPQEVDEKENGGMEISDLDLMEVSAVGIPSNPDAVPQAMGTAVQMAKNAGLDQNQIMNSIRKSFEDTMTEKDNQEDSTENEGKSEEQNTEESKQFNDDEIQEILGVVGGALEAHMDEALQQIEEELQNESENEEETEEDEMDEDEEEEEDTVETDNVEERVFEELEERGIDPSTPVSDVDEETMKEIKDSLDLEDSEKKVVKALSDHTEDSEKSSSESADDESEKDSGLSEDEKTVNEDKDEGRKLNAREDKDGENQEDSGEKSSVDYDPRMAV